MLANGATLDVELVVIVSADQISLMQDVKKSSKRDRQHMPALMESAKGMLSNRATPDVELVVTVSADQICLMQDVKKSSKRDGQHMSALMESDKGMLSNGATPDVELVVTGDLTTPCNGLHDQGVDTSIFVFFV